MVHFVIILLIIAVFCLIMGTTILLKNPKKPIHILFFIKIIITAFYIFSSALIQLTTDYQTIVLLDKITTCCVSILVTLLVHFALILTLKTRKKILEFLIYLPLAFIIPLVAIQSNLNFVLEIKRIYDFNIPVEQFNSLWFCIFAIHMNLCLFTFMGLLIRWIKTTSINKEKKQGKVLLIFFLSFVVSLYISDILLPASGIFYTPHLDALLVSLYLLGVFYSITKYNMFKFKVSDLFEDIVYNMQDMLIVLDPDMKIIRANKRMLDTLSFREEELAHRPFSRIIIMDEYIETNLRQIVSGQIPNFKCRLTYLKGQERIITDSYLSRITDRFGDYSGIMVLSRENLSLRHFKEKYQISGRQIEIILLSISGLTNPEIASRLGLTKRTVESHFFHIYSKMNIKNKVELMKIAVEYQLV